MKESEQSCRKSVFLTLQTQKELAILIEHYKENRSRLVSRLINAEYIKLLQAAKEDS